MNDTNDIEKLVDGLLSRYVLDTSIKEKIKNILTIVISSFNGTVYQEKLNTECLESIIDKYLKLRENYGKKVLNTAYSGLIPALLYIADNCDLSFKEILSLNWPFPVNGRYVWKVLKRIMKVKEVEVNRKPKTIEELVEDLAGRLRIEDGELIEKAKKIAKQAYRPGRSKYGLAAASLYLACREKNDDCFITQARIASLAGVTTVTLRKRVKDILELIQGGCKHE